MRLLAIIALALLLSGCTSQNAASPQANSTPNTPPQVNQSEPAAPEQNLSSGNITKNPAPPPSALNQTNSTNVSNSINSSVSTPSNATNSTVPQRPSGLDFAGGNFTLVLDDVSLVPNAQGPCGIFSIRDRNGSIIDKLLICPPESQDWVAPGGHLYRIRVEKVAAGYSTRENWAQVSIFG